MVETLFITPLLQLVIIIVIATVYIAVLLMLGWESHSKYGTGYYYVGACLAGVILAFVNYRYWIRFQSIEDVKYPMYAMILINIFLVLIGLWAYLIFHYYFIKRSKAMRAGTRLQKRVFAEEAAATGTGRFRDLLTGWEGDIKLDMLIVEGKFDQAEDYLDGIIMRSNQERDESKARHYEQYRAVIQKERIFSEETAEFRDDSKSMPERTAKDVDVKRSEDIRDEDLPEGWAAPD